MDMILVTNDNIHTIFPKYIEDNNIDIKDIDTMIDTYMNMIQNKYLFMLVTGKKVSSKKIWPV